MGIQVVEQELSKETEALSDLTDIEQITTDEIANRVNLSRNTVSQYLNELLKQKNVIQIKSRPTNFVDKKIFVHRFFTPKQNIYASLDELIAEQNTKLNVFNSFIGSQQSMRESIDRIVTAISYPPNGLPFIPSGNTGVGKSYLARLAYEYCVQEQILSKDAPLIVLNCAQYFHNPELLSSNLFGYAKGSFTGATTDFKGMLESANGGILFLDECHRLDPESQEKLFSFMDTGTFQRMGDAGTSRHSNVRLIFATTEDLQGTFLKTFMRRIPIAISIPDLNQRSKTELQAHIYHAFINESKHLSKTINVSPWIINRLYNFKYKSNVGELQSKVRILCARVFSRFPDASNINVTSENIGNALLSQLVAVNEQESITQQAVCFQPDSQLTDYKLNDHDENQIMGDLVNRLTQIELDFHDKKFTIEILKQQVSREVAAVMDALVHQAGRYKDESLKYIILVIQKLFDYLDTSFFVRIKGNAIVAISNFIYSKQNIHLNFTPATITKLQRLLSVLSENAVMEYQILKAFLDLVKTKLDYKLDTFDKLFLLSYLVGLELNDKRTGKRAIILAHGFSTASSIADVANQFLSEKVFDSFDMPLSVSVNQVKEFMTQYLNNHDCSKGLVVLVDMGSLMVLPKTLNDSINGPLLVLNNVSTQEAVMVGDMIQQDLSLDEIGHQVHQSLLPKYQLTYPVIKKVPMIVTTCHTGIGSAKQIETLLKNSVPENSGYHFESIDYNYLKNFGQESPIFKKYEVEAIVGTADPQIQDIPFISLENLVSSDGSVIIQKLFPTITDSAILRTINDNLIQNLSIERLLSAVTILDVKKVIQSVSKMIQRLEENVHIQLTNNQRATLYVHISSLIERLIRNEPPLKYEPEDVEARAQGLSQIQRSLSDIELTYGVKAGPGELNYLYDIIFQP